MKTNQIILEQVNLHYASVAYKERSLKSMLSRTMKRPQSKAKVADIHALKDISITIQRGERVGLISLKQLRAFILYRQVN
jgi:lipopolysaccharide transport system ATP-binding protein